MNDITITIPASVIRELINQELDARAAAEEAELNSTKELRKPMRSMKYACYPKLRNAYSSYEALGKVINKSKTAVEARMRGRIPFTDREKEMILKDLNIEDTAKNRRKYFDIGRKEKVA